MSERASTTSVGRVGSSRREAARRGWSRWSERAARYILLLSITLIFLFPLLYLVNIALKTPQNYLFDPSGLTSSLDVANFSNAWAAGDFGLLIKNTLLYTVAATVLSVACSLFVAFPIARRYVRWSGIWYTFFVMALFLPDNLIPQFQLLLKLGLYNTPLGYVLLMSGVGLGPFLITGYLTSVPRELYEAASVDGCGYIRYVLIIIVPLIKPILVTASVLQSIGVWNEIIRPTVMLTSHAYAPVSQGLFAFYGEYTDSWTLLAAAVLIVAAPMLILYVCLQRFFIEGALSGAVK